jgi:hypothetical protein
LIEQARYAQVDGCDTKSHRHSRWLAYAESLLSDSRSSPLTGKAVRRERLHVTDALPSGRDVIESLRGTHVRYAVAASRDVVGSSDGHPGQINWDYDRAEIIADGVVHVIGVCLGILGAVTRS